MSATAWGLFALFLIVLLLAAWPLSIWLTRICADDVPSWVKNIETPLWRLGGVSVEHSMKWSQYAVALLSFNILGVAAVMKSALPLFFLRYLLF